MNKVLHYQILLVLVFTVIFTSFSYAFPPAYTTTESRWISEGHEEDYSWHSVSDLQNYTCDDGTHGPCQVSGSQCAGNCSAACPGHRHLVGSYGSCNLSSNGQYWCSDNSDPPHHWVDTSHWEDYTVCHYVNNVTSWYGCGATTSHIQYANDYTWGTVEGGSCSNVSSTQFCNRVPTAPTVDLTPDSPPNPKTDADLTCTITMQSTDPDGDPIHYMYQWGKDGTNQSALQVNSTTLLSNTISNTNTFFDDNWGCRVTPIDSYSGSGTYAQDSVKIQNTAPGPPALVPSSGRKIDSTGSITLVADSVVDPDVDFREAKGQDLTYTGSIFVDPAPPTFVTFTPSVTPCDRLSCTGSKTFTGLDRTHDNCIALRVSDGIATSNSSPKSCFPVTKSIYFSNTTISGPLQGTRWIRNHFGATDPTEQVSCTFTAGDLDITEGRTGRIDYNVGLYYKISGQTAKLLTSSTGTAINNFPTTVPFSIGTRLPVGTRFYCNVDLNDGFLQDSLSSYTGPASWTIQGAWKNDTNLGNVGWVEIVNTIPGAPDIKKLDRVFAPGDIDIGVTVYDNNGVDPDVLYPLRNDGQVLNYSSRIYEDNTPRGIFNAMARKAADWFYSQNLTLDRNYCADAQVYDILEYSQFDTSCSAETPFVPECAHMDLTSEITNLTPIADNNMFVEVTVSCNRDPQFDQAWKIGLLDLNVYSRDGTLQPISYDKFIDCNSSPVTININVGSRAVDNYSIRFSYGGTYDLTPLTCFDSTLAYPVDKTVPPNPDVCSDVGFVPILRDAVRNTNDTTDFNFGLWCSINSAMNSVVFTDSVLQPQGSKNLTGINCTKTPTEIMARMDTNALGSYTATFNYTAPGIGACAYPFSIYMSDTNIEPGTGTDDNKVIPDANIIVALVVLFIVVLIATRKSSKKSKKK